MNQYEVLHLMRVLMKIKLDHELIYVQEPNLATLRLTKVDEQVAGKLDAIESGVMAIEA